MYVLTVDQIDSQNQADQVDAAIRDIESRFGAELLARPERTAGDEFQVATERGSVALDLALTLVRAGAWSVGLGVGDVRPPVGPSVRAMTGTAFVNAREAVSTAKKRPSRFSLVADDPQTAALDPLIRLLLALRERRTAEGWELFDLLDPHPDLTLTDAAGRLGISVQAASQRALTAGLRLDREARDVLGDLLTGGRIGG
ncbi:DNA-binding protein [Pseudolysinimonas yzui]|uniref:Transcriptional regulator n=1 Tax=Pseudolysinimonas yzui TaxID=2708254 RepID=A0A8J3GPL4_9MICO|nr:DNA-binding protein [Pseudolysinimonas yzui]GHF10866.1 transcriptional regulator [Pseudolysinimonas yzui]